MDFGRAITARHHILGMSIAHTFVLPRKFQLIAGQYIGDTPSEITLKIPK